uniref:putative reverse transcriptase/maturase n=1 Tax=Pulvinaster venetus TaxID=427767 RepID=UPI001FCE0D91|nr:putative reverse transcriptase/maturase [Pulvinaster venetus]UNJ16940.1 putative reverse transcriptase/maturase [Pulvinaster venetus]
MNDLDQNILINMLKINTKFSSPLWNKLELFVKTLQKKIYQASSEGNSNNLISYQQILINSLELKYLALKYVLHWNKKYVKSEDIASIDLNYIKQLCLNNSAEVSYISVFRKSNKREKKASLKDLVLQKLVLMVLEPEWEARIESGSYGFKEGYSIQQSIIKLYSFLVKDCRYINATIISCTINFFSPDLNHQLVLKKIKYKGLMYNQIKAWLEASYMNIYKKLLNPRFQYSNICLFDKHTITPLIADIILYGLQHSLEWQSFKTLEKQNLTNVKSCDIVRYANHLIIVLNHNDINIISNYLSTIKQFLKLLGISLSNTDLTISSLYEGFDFLGYNFKRYNNLNTWNSENSKVIISPSAQNKKKYFRSIKQCLYHKDKLNRWRANSQMRQDDIIEKLNPIIQNFSNYYCHFVAVKILKEMDRVLNEIIYRYAVKKYKTAKYEKWNHNWIKIINGKKIIAYQDNFSKNHITLKSHLVSIYDTYQILPQYFNYYFTNL